MAESGLIVRVAEAEPLVDDLRLLHTEAARLGVPAHVTVLFPFVPPARIDGGIVARLRRVLGSQRAFAFELTTVGRFAATTYLAPEPAERFIALTDALVREFPDHRPYAGAFDAIVPHLTVADGDAVVASTVEHELAARLALHGPVRSTCMAVDLFESTSGRWRPMHRIVLAR